jgi:fatty-acyl-CoA synthase
VSIEPAAGPRVPGSAGLRLPFTQVRVVPWREGRAQLAEDCAAGDTGVVVLRGPHVSPGYTDPARNGGMFEDDWLVSGDLGHLDAQGYVHVTGRAKDLIIRGSHNIDPGLVEDAFLAHPAVAMCAVVGEPDAHSGEVPAAFVTLKPGAQVQPEALLAAVAGQVYERPAVPHRVVVLDALPLTAVGKVYKPALRLRVTEMKLAEVFAAAAPGLAFAVQAREQGSAAVAEVQLECAPEAEVTERLRAALGAIAVETRFVFRA